MARHQPRLRRQGATEAEALTTHTYMTDKSEPTRNLPNVAGNLGPLSCEAAAYTLGFRPDPAYLGGPQKETGRLEQLLSFFHHITHTDLRELLAQGSAAMGIWLYVVLFLIVFCETGLVVTPFLPGDSLLFAVGAVCAVEGSGLNVMLIVPLLIIAAVLGDAVNYSVGHRLGPKVFRSETSWLLNKKHLLRTQEFYERYGGKTIIIARFVPIVRTFAPFVAGIGKMTYKRFATFNVVGALAWVLLFIPAGYKFGSLPFVKRNFQLVIVAIIILSVMPAVFEFLRERRALRAARAASTSAAVEADPQ